MDVTLTVHPESSEVTLQVSASARELGAHMRSAVQRLSKERTIKGFRPGKAPVELVEQVFGTERVLHEALDLAVPHFFASAVRSRKVDAIGRPTVSIEHASRQAGVSFQARVAVLPQVTLGNVSALSVDRREVIVTDEDIEREIKHLAKMRCQYLDVARAAQAGDTVIADWRIVIDGAVIEGGEAIKQPVHLGESLMVPDFEKGLLGICAGEKREFTMVFPDHFASQALRGRSVTARVTAHAVQKRVLPEINDAFAKQLGDFTDLTALTYTLKSNLIREREQRETERRRAALAEQLAEITQYPALPAVLVDKEIERSLAELQQMLAMQQTTLESYAAGRGVTVAAVREEMRAAAVRAVKIGLALRQFANEQNITVEESKITEQVQEYLRRFASLAQVKHTEDPAELKDRITHLLRNQKTLVRLEELATGTSALEHAG